MRNKISTDLGIRVDLDTDPMTAVATGAAIYAEDRNWDDEKAGAKRDGTGKYFCGTGNCGSGIGNLIRARTHKQGESLSVGQPDIAPAARDVRQ